MLTLALKISTSDCREIALIHIIHIELVWPCSWSIAALSHITFPLLQGWSSNKCIYHFQTILENRRPARNPYSCPASGHCGSDYSCPPHSTQALKSSRAWRAYLCQLFPLVAVGQLLEIRMGRERREESELAEYHGQMSRNQTIIIFSASVLEFLELFLTFL